MRFTALLHHVDLEMLRTSYESLKKPGQESGCRSDDIDMAGKAGGTSGRELLQKVHVGSTVLSHHDGVYILQGGWSFRDHSALPLLEDKKSCSRRQLGPFERRV
jgi:hypothetical protein